MDFVGPTECKTSNFVLFILSRQHIPAIQHSRNFLVRASDLQSNGRGFYSWPFHFCAMTLGKLFTHTCLCHSAVLIGASCALWLGK